MEKESKQRTADVAITRPLHNFELDKYWATVAMLAIRQSWRVVFEKFSWRRLIVPAVVTVVASLLQFYFMGWASTADNLKIVGTSLVAGLCVFVVLVFIYVARKPCELYIGATEEITRLSGENERLKAPLAETELLMAEEDPKVYLEALNNNIAAEVVQLQVWNKGQRVNPAHRITVQPIAGLGSVSFDVVDCLDMATYTQLVPHIKDAPTPFGGHDILPELHKAWEAATAKTGQADTKFEFEMILHYEDVNRIKKFETKVKLLYFPLRDSRRSANRGSDQDIVRVIENRPRRVA
jgi:hypothetical protein